MAAAPVPARSRTSRRTWIAILVPTAVLGVYLLVTGLVRRHVDALIAHSVGKPLPEFTLRDRAGKVWSAADLRGRRAVLHFFRSRCHSCDLEAPALRNLETRLPADVVWLHVMTDAVLGWGEPESAATIGRHAYARPVLMADAAFADAFHRVSWSNVTPVTYVVDAAGVIRFGLRGRQEPGVVEQALAAVAP